VSAKKARPWFLSIVDWPRMAPKHANRAFPWCRLYHDTLESAEYMALTKSQQRDYWHLVMLANRTGNLIKDDPEYLCFMLRDREPPDTEALVKAGLVHRQRAGKKLATRRQDATTGEERRGEDQGNILDRGKDEGPADAGQPALSFILKDRPGQPYPLEAPLLAIMEARFPRVRVRDELAKFAAHVAADPQARAPTLNTLQRSMEGWLSRAQGWAMLRGV
jgi:hypothetical protein